MWPSARDSASDRVRLWLTQFSHPVEDVAGKSGFNDLGISSTRSHAVAEDRLASEERVLGAGLSTLRADSVNAGIECLIIHLHQKHLGRAASLEEHREWLANTDGDDNGAVIPLLNTTAKLEVVDHWGTPIAYIHHDSYAKSFTVQPKGEEGEAQPPEIGKAMKSDGVHLNLHSYQLISAGQDQTFNTKDDVTFPENPLHGEG